MPTEMVEDERDVAVAPDLGLNLNDSPRPFKTCPLIKIVQGMVLEYQPL